MARLVADGSSSRVTTKTVLIIEDDRFLSSMYSEKLSLEGFRVLVAFDGPSGVTTALRDHPDLILLDVLLPGFDGFEVLRRLRADAASARTKVIMLTNLNQAEQVARAETLGANDYLVKAHFVPSEIVDKVRAQLI